VTCIVSNDVQSNDKSNYKIRYHYQKNVTSLVTRNELLPFPEYCVIYYEQGWQVK